MANDADMPPVGPKQLPPKSGSDGNPLPSGSTATNGHWVHDDAGPSVHVPASSDAKSHLENVLATLRPGLRCTLGDGTITVDGIVNSDAEAAEIRALVGELEPGMILVDRLTMKGATSVV